MVKKGMPSFYTTINPADIYNPVVRFLAGHNIDVDNLLDDDVPQYHNQSILIAKNPVIVAQFFNIYMKAFISTILRYDPKGKDLEGSILEVVKAYYGCIEAQGQGTLHCYMLIWLEGGLNPDEIKQKFMESDNENFQQHILTFLDDSISNYIPVDPDPFSTTSSSSHH